MPATDPQLLLGHLAVHYELLTKEQVAEAWSRRSTLDGAGDFAAFLVAEGYLEEPVVRKLLVARQRYLARQESKRPSPEESNGGGSSSAEPPVAAAAEPVTGPIESPEVPSEGATAGVAEEAEVAEPPPPEPRQAPAEPTAGPSGELGYAPGVGLETLLQRALELGASDLHVHSGAPLQIRLHGRLKPTTGPLQGEEAERLIHGLLSEELRARLAEEPQVDFVQTIEGVGRFRGNVYRQQRGLDAVFRTIPPAPPSLAELQLPETLERLTAYHQGMVLLTGPAGCGKSSTMAALVHLINASRPDHIITIEDPIEYLHASERCVVNQRQVGSHTESFARALRAALREDPDVIAIGELRDLESVSLALTAAETGHLVLGTLHTSSAIRTVNRLLGVFPSEEQAQIRTMVSESLRGIVSQRLIPRADGQGLVPAVEVLINTKAIGNLIRENKTFQIASVMQTGTAQGMCLLDASLQQLLDAGTITVEEARHQAEDPRRFS